MELVSKNPYRILGLPATATKRELVKRTNDLEMLAEYGKTKNYPLDLQNFCPLIRAPDSIAHAAKSIEIDSEKLLYAFFWFLSVDSIDELALECLESGDVNKAWAIWDQQIAKTDYPKFSWYLNRAVLAFLHCCENFDSDKFESALEDLGYLTDDHFDQLKAQILGATATNIDTNKLLRRLIDELITYVDSLKSLPYGKEKLDLLEHTWSFSEEEKEYLQTKIYTPCINAIEGAIEHSCNLRQAEDSSEIKHFNGLRKFDSLVHALEEFSANYKIQTIINRFADEGRLCSIYANNELSDPELAKSLLNWVQDLPSYGQVAQNIEDAQEKLEEILSEKRMEKAYGPIFESLKEDIKTLAQAESKLNFYKRELLHANYQDEHYLTISSACVNQILNHLIDEFNNSFQLFERDKDIDALYSTATKVSQLTRQMKSFDLEPAMQRRVNENYNTITTQITEMEGLRRKIKAYQEPGFYKSENNAAMAGVLAGLAEWWGMNANALRIIFILGSLFLSVWPGIVLYILLGVVMPKREPI